MILDTIEKGVNFPVIHILRITDPSEEELNSARENAKNTRYVFP